METKEKSPLGNYIETNLNMFANRKSVFPCFVMAYFRIKFRAYLKMGFDTNKGLSLV